MTTPVHLFAAVPHYACQRESPRPCVNQALVDALAPLREERCLIYGTGHPKSISYATAISCIIGCPYKIETIEQARALHKIGEKLEKKIEEFLQTGKIVRSEQLQTSEKIRILKELHSMHGVGASKAQELYSQGVHSLAELQRREPSRYDTMMRWHEDLQTKIPRSEVESVLEFVRLQLERVEPGAYLVLCGGYRRGKELSNDIDILITYPHQEGKEKGVLRRLVARLQAKGFIPPDGLLTMSECATTRTIPDNKAAEMLDSLDKALIIFEHPANASSRPRAIFRRVDLVFSSWQSFGSAVVGWTGSTQFERDLRQRATDLRLRFDSGGIRNDLDMSQVIPALTERDVFRVLQIDYLPPHLRCADP